MLSWFAIFHADEAAMPGQLDGVADVVRAVPGLVQGLVMTPAADAAHPFVGQGRAPALVLQLHFNDIEALEGAIAEGSPLAALPGRLPGHSVSQQAMMRRRYPVPDTALQTAPGDRPCSFLVHYPGPAADLNAWNRHYNTHHPPLMARFPGVRLIEIYTRIDWVCGLPWPAANAMQRNKLMFDSPAALTAALASPVLAAMRADFDTFPPFEGGNVHHAFDTLMVG